MTQNDTLEEHPKRDSKRAHLAEEMESYRSFSEFMKTHNKTYNTMTEVNARFQVFKNNMRKIKSENTTSDLYNTSVTIFSDMTDQEFQQKYLGLKVSLSDIIEANTLAEENEEPEGRHLQTLPSSLDWRTKGAVSSVDNQGGCACCWSFGIAANLEGQYFLKYGTMIKFSQQYLINCNGSGYGCDGGLFPNVYKWLINYSDGLRKYNDMPYLGYQATCSVSNFSPVVRVTGYINISTDESTIMYELNRRGPLLAALNANRLKYYTGGILASGDDICDPYNLNHAVLLVGYGTTTSGYPYWIVKNSWGTWWGESGYFRILRGSGTCGINKLVMSGTVG